MKRLTILVLLTALVGIVAILANRYLHVNTVGDMTVISYGDRAALWITSSPAPLALRCLPPVTEYPIRTE